MAINKFNATSKFMAGVMTGPLGPPGLVLAVEFFFVAIGFWIQAANSSANLRP